MQDESAQGFSCVKKDLYLARKIAAACVYERMCALLLDGKSAAPFFGGLGISSIAIYGVEGIGRRFYEYMKKSGVRVDCFIDRNWRSYDQNAFAVVGLDGMPGREFGAVVIAVPEHQCAIMRDLLAHGLQPERILTVSQVLFGIE